MGGCQRFFLAGAFHEGSDAAFCVHHHSRPLRTRCWREHSSAFRGSVFFVPMMEGTRRAPRKSSSSPWGASTSILPLDVSTDIAHLQVGKLRTKEATRLAQGRMNPDRLTLEPSPRTSALSLHLEAGPRAGSGALPEARSPPPRQITSIFSSVWPSWPSTGMMSLSSSWPPTRCSCTLETWPCT